MKTKISPLLILSFGLIAVLVTTSAKAGSATWNLSPSSDNWNTAVNWTPATVPNGTADVATFDVSNTTAISVTTNIVVNSVVFNAGASAFTIDAKGAVSNRALRITGTGVVNNGTNTQNFTASGDAAGYGTISLEGSATAGSNVSYTANGNPVQFSGPGAIELHDSASADAATLVTNPGLGANSLSGSINFFDSSSAATATIINNASSFYGAGGGVTGFLDQTRADTATIINNAGQYGHGQTTFGGTSNADHATIINYASTALTEAGITIISDTATAGSATFTNYGTAVTTGEGGRAFFNARGTTGNAFFVNYGADKATGEFAGARTEFYDQSDAGHSNLMALGGTNGGVGALINFAMDSQGDGARVILSGNGGLQISLHDLPGVTVGSLEGEGVVFLGGYQLSIGSTERNTAFAGVIQDGGEGGGTGGSLEKTGKGKLTLSGANTYTGGTTINHGGLLVRNSSGSGTGSGPVNVNMGSLGGTGIIAGPVTVGKGAGQGAFLVPGNRKTLGTLTIQSLLTLNADATYDFALNSSRLASDEVIANGVTINGAALLYVDNGTVTLPPGTSFTVISNTSATPISGTFSNLPDGVTITMGSNNFQVSYEGGDGNDLTLTVVP